jgi:hypothetical protein
VHREVTSLIRRAGFLVPFSVHGFPGAHIADAECRGYLALNRQYIERIPLILPTTGPENRVTDAERIEQLAERMLTLNAQSPSNTPHEQAARTRQIAATDAEIHQLVYELYGLTNDEIGIVEEATAGDGR